MPDPEPEDRSQWYRIRVKGHLGRQWSDWFYGMRIESRKNETILSGPIRDQAALHGLLMKVRDLGLPLIAVDRVDGNSDHDVSDAGKEG